MLQPSLKLYLKNQAQKRNGIYKAGFLFQNPRLELLVGQSNVLIYYDKEENAIIFESPLNSHGCDIYIGPQKYGMISIVGGTNVQDIIIGNKDFNRSFIVQGKIEDVEAILDEDVINGLIALFQFLPVLIIKQNKLRLILKNKLDNEASLSRFIDTGLKLLYQARKL